MPKDLFEKHPHHTSIGRITIALGICMCVAIVIIVACRELIPPQNTTVPFDAQAARRAELISLLHSSPPAPASEVKSMAIRLSKSNTGASKEEKQYVINQLHNQ